MCFKGQCQGLSLLSIKVFLLRQLFLNIKWHWMFSLHPRGAYALIKTKCCISMVVHSGNISLALQDMQDQTEVTSDATLSLN